MTSKEHDGFITFEQVIFHEPDIMNPNERKEKFKLVVTIPTRYIKGISQAENDLQRIAKDASIELVNPMPDVTIITLVDGNQVYSYISHEEFIKALGSTRIGDAVKEPTNPQEVRPMP